MVNRKSKQPSLPAGANKTKALVGEAVVLLLEPVSEFVLNITAEAGKEFAVHIGFGEPLGIGVYFARPCHSQGHGLNKHTSGLERQYCGKVDSLCGLDPAKVQRGTDPLNRRPRKALGFRPPRSSPWPLAAVQTRHPSTDH